MKNAVYKISLDIYEHGSQAVLKAKKTDTGRKLHITLRAGGTQYIIEDDCYAVFKATKPDGSILYNACTIENNEIIYEFTEQTCTAVGRCRCEIALYGLDNKLITSPKFALLVDGTIYPDEIVESTDEFSALTALVTESIEAISNAEKATEDATKAAKEAGSASNNASEATTAANNAANSASESAAGANAAKNNANLAAQSANNAAEGANGAATAANNAAKSANTAAEGANAAKDSANQAAESAHKTAINVANTVKNFMVIGKAEGTSIALTDAIEQFFVGCRIFGKTTQDGTPTPDTPVDLVSAGESGAINVTVSGKNLVNAIVNGTHSAAYAGALYCKLDVLEPNTEYTISFVGANGNKVYANENLFEFKEILCDGNRQYVTLKTQRNISKDRTDQYTEDRWIIFKNYASNTVVPDFKDVQIERGSTPTTYEPHKAQNISVSVSNGLPGIPVVEGGNYTDANGQQWICDEIDFTNGFYIKRLFRYSVTGDENITRYESADITAYGNIRIEINYLSLPAPKENSEKTAGLCSHFMYRVKNQIASSFWANKNTGLNTCQFRFVDALARFPTLDDFVSYAKTQNANGTPIVIIYELEEPEKIPLSEEELAAYASLHTYRGNTTVTNDAGAYMKLEYVMDAKKYIDSLVSSAILTATVE